ncbi:MAG: hypothetical protein KJO95_00905, partial [Gammaproteobacteria bacterium]|nr:hypothetical protein [Gammaproteobacteria bacterium]
KGGLKGKLKIHDKDMDIKIDAKTITSLTTGEGDDCDGQLMDGVNTFAFTAIGSFEMGDNVTENVEFEACGVDNGKNNEAPFDNLYVSCLECGYNTGVRMTDDGDMDPSNDNDIDGGNIHLHDAIVNPVTPNQQAAASSAPEGESTSSPEGESASAPEGDGESAQTYDPQAEPAGSPDVVTLESMLLSKVPTGTPMVLTAIVENHGGGSDGTPVTLRWTTESGLQGESAAVVNTSGIANFVVTVPAGRVEYTAWVGELSSNGVRITGF